MPFVFGFKTVWLLLGFAQGLVIGSLVIRRSFLEDRLSDLLFGLLLIFSCFHIAHYMLAYGGWYDTHDAYSSFMFYFPFHNFLIIAPLIYFYFRSLTNFTFRFTRNDWLHFLPGILNLLLYLFIYLGEYVIGHKILGQPLNLHFQTKGYFAELNQAHIQDYVNFLALIATVYYLWMTWRDYRRYRVYIKSNFSNLGSIRFQWVKHLLLLLIAGMFFYWIIDIIDAVVVQLQYSQYWFSYLGFSIMVYFLSIFGYANRFSYEHKLMFQPSKVKIEPQEVDSTKVEETVRQEKERIQQLVETNQWFLNPGITLDELAEQLEMTSHQLSKILNAGFDQNFNDFINSYRVEAVKKRIEEGMGEQFTLLSLALDAGFNSKATFNRAFRKFAGMSPSEYQRSLRKN